ncbi:MAG: tyrosine-protein kinase family protein [Sterolibacteriaceae bacterium]|nr:tyrosine-protein kinase family protein [Sterolibacteriaceae bacterium]MBK9085322.1 tyrosine-protein kinase family protein [Sterolibacteriaceae bacterium]
MSVIERAAKRLEEIRRSGTNASSAADSARAEAQSSDAGVMGFFPQVEKVLADEVLRPAELPFARPVSPAQSKQVAIDIGRLRDLGMVTPIEPKSRVAEEFRVIKRPLLRNATGKSAAAIADANLIMITSALPGEGKSTTAVNLAMSIAMELDHTVLLVDADVSKPSIPGLLGIAAERGLLDLLMDETLDPSDVLLRTNVETLSVLPSGNWQSRATELLSSDSISRLLREMANRYSERIIIFDSPPLLPSNESRALATLMGQIVVVVGAESTTHAALKQALAAIETCPVKLLMLNKSRISAGTGYGHYGSYGYGYGYGN